MPDPRPQLVALLLCDRAFQEAGSKSWHVSGIFDTIQTRELPTTQARLTVFVALSDFAGDAAVQVVVRDPEGGVVKAARAKVPRIPLGAFHYAFPLPDVELRAAGSHTVELLAGDELVALRSFRVSHLASDPEREAREAQQLAEQHRDELLAGAREFRGRHPDLQAVGLVASSGASACPWFREAFEAVFGDGPPPAGFVATLDADRLVRLLGDNAAQAQEWLAVSREEAPHVLCVAIVTATGVRFARFPIRPFE